MTNEPLRRAALLAVSLLLSACRTERPTAPRIALRPCELAGVSVPLRCAEVPVPEVRGDAERRTIRLRVVVVPALQSPAAPEPWVELVGGPGNAATDFARQFVEDLAYIRQTHDVLLVDQRGTGGSNPLYCESLSLHQISSLPPRFPLAAVGACRDSLASHAALAHYTSADAADDLDAVREALGYERLNLFGSTYGTRVVLEYLRRYAAHARIAIMWGGVAPTFQRPRWYPRDGESALSLLIADCEREVPCRQTFPDIRGDLRALMTRLTVQPVPVSLTDPRSHRSFATAITAAGVAQAIWSALSEPDRARQLPWVIQSAASGDFAPLLALDVASSPPRRRYYNGMHLSVVCGEEVLQSSREQLIASSDSSFMPADRSVEYRDACQRWGVPLADSADLRAVVSDVPTLIVSGAMDPITPPSWGQRVAQTLGNRRHLVIPPLSHEASGLRGAACLDSLVAQFLMTADPTAVRMDCVAGIQPPPFVLPPRRR